MGTSSENKSDQGRKSQASQTIQTLCRSRKARLSQKSGLGLEAAKDVSAIKHVPIRLRTLVRFRNGDKVQFLANDDVTFSHLTLPYKSQKMCRKPHMSLQCRNQDY